MPLVLLPFLGSGFVPTDSMPTGLRWFAEYQPFTPIIETLRGLLMDKPIGNNAWIALGWCAVIALGGYLWSKRLFNREYARCYAGPTAASGSGREDAAGRQLILVSDGWPAGRWGGHWFAVAAKGRCGR